MLFILMANHNFETLCICNNLCVIFEMFAYSHYLQIYVAILVGKVIAKKNATYYKICFAFSYDLYVVLMKINALLHKKSDYIIDLKPTQPFLVVYLKTNKLSSIIDCIFEAELDNTQCISFV